MTDLTREIRHYIFFYLPKTDLAATEATCKALRAASLNTEHDELWLQRCVKDFGEKPTMPAMRAMQPLTMKNGYQYLQGLQAIRKCLTAAKTCPDDDYSFLMQRASDIAARYDIDISKLIKDTKAARPAARGAAITNLREQREKAIKDYLLGFETHGVVPNNNAAPCPNRRVPIDISR